MEIMEKEIKVFLEVLKKKHQNMYDEHYFMYEHGFLHEARFIEVKKKIVIEIIEELQRVVVEKKPANGTHFHFDD